MNTLSQAPVLDNFWLRSTPKKLGVGFFMFATAKPGGLIYSVHSFLESWSMKALRALWGMSYKSYNKTVASLALHSGNLIVA